MRSCQYRMQYLIKSHTILARACLAYARREIRKHFPDVGFRPHRKLRPRGNVFDMPFHQVTRPEEVTRHQRTDDLSVFLRATIRRMRSAIHRHDQRAARDDLDEIALQQ